MALLGHRIGMGLLRSLHVVVGLAMLVLGATDAMGQIVTGRVIDAISGDPLPGAVVRVIAASGSTHATALANALGAFQVSIPIGGAFRVHVEMIAHRPWTSEEMHLIQADSIHVEVRLEVAPIRLDDIRAESRNLCTHVDGLSRVTEVLWRDIKTALAAEQVSRQAGRLRFLMETFERDVAADSLVVLHDIRRRTTSRGSEPFRSVSMDQLDEQGFFGDRTDGGYLFGPSTTVLLDEWFADTHCLGVVPPVPGNPLLGIHFAPNAERGQPEIQGTMWLDKNTRELRVVEFGYVALPDRIPPGSNGALHLERLPDGSVIINEWRIRSPILELSEVRLRRQRRPVERVIATRETGGEVLRVELDGVTIYRAIRATVEGMVYDSVNRRPLHDARISVVGTGFLAISDSAGSYRLEDLPDGTYRLNFEHPRLLSFGYHPKPVRVELGRGEVHPIDFGIPSRAKLQLNDGERARLDSLAVAGGAVGINARGVAPTRGTPLEDARPVRLLGRVIDHATGDAILGAQIRLVAIDSVGSPLTTQVRTDDNGHFEMPALPAGQYDVIIQATEYEGPTISRVTIEQGVEYRWVIRLRRGGLSVEDIK